MKIIISFPIFSQGGAEKAAQLYLSNLQKKHEVTLIANENLIYKFEKFVQLNKAKNSYINHLKILYKTIRQFQPDSIITFKGHIISVTFIFLIRAIQRHKFTIIMRESNDIVGYSNFEIKSKIKNFIFFKILKKIPAMLCDFVICNSVGSKKNFCKALNIYDNKVKAIFNPTNFIREEKYKWHEKDYDLIFLGRLEGQKDPYLFIETVKNISKLKPDIKAIIVGDGSLKNKLKQLIKSYNLEMNVRFVKFSDKNKRIFLQKSKIFVLTSQYEGMPNVILEALAHGCEVLSLNIYSGPNEILPQRFIVKHRDPYEIGEKIHLLLNQRIAKIKTKEVLSIKEMFSFNTFSYKIHKILQ